MLLHRIVAEVIPSVWPEILRPYRVGRDSLLRPYGVETAVDDLLRRLGESASVRNGLRAMAASAFDRSPAARM